jgi:hydrogenase expression/formation protein HypC
MCLAIPGRIVSIHDDRGLRMGRVDFGGVVKEVCLAYVPEAGVGDYALVHVGFAIATIDPAAAETALTTFDEIEQLEREGRHAASPSPAPAGQPPS